MRRLGATGFVSDWEAVNAPQYMDSLYATFKRMQYQLGASLVADIWELPEKCATIQLVASTHYDHEFQGKKLYLESLVNPARSVKCQVAISHFEYFPADWVCRKCGCIVNGYEHPRMCSQCAAPRDAKTAMEEAQQVYRGIR